MINILQVTILLLPICLGRVLESSTPRQLQPNTVFLRSNQESKRLLQPALNIRTAPTDFMEMITGDTKYLECEAGGTPPPTIHWLKDGEMIAQNLYETLRTADIEKGILEFSLGLGFTRSRLFIDCATSKDAGKYTCVAENEYIRKYSTSQVSVTDTLNEHSGELCLAKKTFGTGARIHMWTHTRLEIMGTDVQLFCRSHGAPYPQVAWKGPNNKILNDSKKYQIMPNGDLIIRKIMWSDMGVYICQAKNSDGSDETSIFLYPTMPEGEKKR